ncbi:MAG: circadian clock KaiB family protein [Planctomycetota bacterium]
MSATQQPPQVSLRLFVAGAGSSSTEALLCVRKLCEEELQGRCELQVIDVHRQPEMARDSGIIATPTLVKDAPPPTQRFFGNLGDTSAILAGLGLQSETDRRGPPASRARQAPLGRPLAGDGEPARGDESEAGLES